MKHTQAYRTAYRANSRASEAMTDGELRRAYASAVHHLDWHCTPAAQARHDVLEAEMEHRDCYA